MSFLFRKAVIDISFDAKTIAIMISIAVLFFVFGHLIGRINASNKKLDPKGKIIFSTYLDENDEETPRCTFKLDLEIEEIEKQKYIIFEVVKE